MKDYRQTELVYAYVSGSGYVVFTVLFILAFCKLEKTLKQGEAFGLEMTEQRSNIRKFYFVMCIGYSLRIPIQFLYGSYYLLVT